MLLCTKQSRTSLEQAMDAMNEAAEFVNLDEAPVRGFY
jgi:hypothetical protein